MFAAFFINVVLLHAQVGSGLPLMGSTQGSPAAPSLAGAPIVLTVADGAIVLPVGEVTVLQ